jgi:hypothetical protein
MVGPNNMFDWIKKLSGKKQPAKSIPVTENKPKKLPEKTAKELATEKNEPYISIVNLDLDLENLHQGAFELDWNDIFVARLIKAGYMIKRDDTDADIVDRWFQNVCRHVVMETWEQDQAMRNSGIYVQSRNLGNGRSEIS